MADQEGSAENKPAQPKQEGQVINLIVKDQLGSEVHFKVKTHTKLEKVWGVGGCCTCSTVWWVVGAVLVCSRDPPRPLGVDVYFRK